MNVVRSRPLVLIAGAFAALVLLAIACNGGDDGPAIEMATATSTTVPLPTPVGFLPRPPGRPPHEPGDPALRRCPPLPIPFCYTEGSRVNVYTVLSMNKAVALRVDTDGQERWILDEAALQEALKPLDEEVVLSGVDVEEFVENERIGMTIVWAPGQGIPWTFNVPDDTLYFVLSPATGFIAHGYSLLQSPLPEGFVDGILASARDITPTPRPEETVPPAERPNDGVYLDHPDGELIWDGPDDRLSSLPGDRAHCRPGTSLFYLFGIPSYFSTGDNFESDPLFHYEGAAEPSDDWRWTGYYHDAWQLWQGDDPWTVYLVHPDEDRFAFVYRSYTCN